MLSRRGFLKKSAVAGALLFTAANGTYVALNNPFTRQQAPSSSPQASDGWEFLSVPIRLKQASPEEAKRYVSLGPETQLEAGGTEYRVLRDKVTNQIFESQILHRKLDPTAHHTITPYAQSFGVPLERKVAEGYVAYCKAASSYLYSRINGIEQTNVDWVVIKQGDDFTSGFNGKAFIVESRYDLLVARVTSEIQKLTYFDIVVPIHREGGYNSIFNDNGISTWSMYLGAGFTALDTPISEPLHLAVSNREIEYRKDTDDLELIFKGNEALVHGISHFISLELVEMLNIPEGVVINEKSLKYLASDQSYALVPQSIKWIGKNGIQAAFDLYMESPGKFLAAING